MKVIGIIFTILGTLGAVFSYCADGGIITMTGSLGALIFGLELILFYVNFVKINSTTTNDDKTLISRKAV